MKAFVVSEDTTRFEEAELPDPDAEGRDLLVRVEAVALNPVDTKVRAGRAGQVLGWDAAGVVEATGPDVTELKIGDEVYYAGDITRPGCFSELHLVDERVVARKPASLDFVSAAAIPLTALTAWEGLYEQLAVREYGSILVINAAGGVGSLVVQLAKQISHMTVVGTASRRETRAWVRNLGADAIIDHHEDLVEQLRQGDMEHVDYIFCCHGTVEHFSAMAELIAPQGRICSIVGAQEPLPMTDKLFSKKASFSWEYMFAKSTHQTEDLASQGEILGRVAELLDEEVLEPTFHEGGELLTADLLTEAHRRQASASVIGKQAYRMR